MLKLDGAWRAPLRICSRITSEISTGSKTLTALLFKIASGAHVANVENVIGNKFRLHRLLDFIHYYLRSVQELVIGTLVKSQNEKGNGYRAYYEERKDAYSDNRCLNLCADIETKQAP